MGHRIKPSKIVNDPVHGFIDLPRGIILSLIDSPEFQRLRRIKQLGLSSFIYPGAVHTRFNHALGAMHLMRQALETLKRKKVSISKKEYKAALIAILLHDIGHGPFSHALEFSLIPGLHHEHMSLALMRRLNQRFKGKLSLAIDIFEGNYERPFFHQLVSSQLDMDRMDYLIRDSFFTGVAEGVVGIDRIIKTLNVANDRLVYENKGIYSLEKFILARRLMYWQVYLHKAALSAEQTMVHILKRVRWLHEQGHPPAMGEPLRYFFTHHIQTDELDSEVLERFIQLDDNDVEYAIKQWQSAADRVLVDLCRRLMERNLLKVQLQTEPFSPDQVTNLRTRYQAQTGLSEEESTYFVFDGKVANQPYFENSHEPISIWFKDGSLVDLATATDLQNIHALSEPVVKYFLCVPDSLRDPLS
ncbi:MAG: HD domain-containing protein [Bacteroidota bacterium]